MDRVLDVSFDTIQSRVDLLQHVPSTNADINDNHVVDNRNMIKDIADGNVTFRFANTYYGPISLFCQCAECMFHVINFADI